MPVPANCDREKLVEVALAFLHLTSYRDGPGLRAWKGLDWDLLDALHERGWIGDPKGKARSVVLTPSGAQLAEKLFQRHFAAS